jgi:SPP1 gp7 family putative phage head morphogenesis protein
MSAVDVIINQLKTVFDPERLRAAVDFLIRKNYNTGMTVVEDRLELDINAIPNKETVQFISDYTFDLVKGMSEDTMYKLQAELSRGIMNSETSAELTKRVKKVMNVGETRAKAIARTESHRAHNVGGFEAAKQSGLNVRKQWFNPNPGSDVCKHLTGKVIGMDEKFSYKGEEFMTPPAHVNCRSRLLYIQEGDEPVEVKHKYRTKRRVKGKWVYTYHDKKPKGQPSTIVKEEPPRELSPEILALARKWDNRKPGDSSDGMFTSTIKDIDPWDTEVKHKYLRKYRSRGQWQYVYRTTTNKKQNKKVEQLTQRFEIAEEYRKGQEPFTKQTVSDLQTLFAGKTVYGRTKDSLSAVDKLDKKAKQYPTPQSLDDWTGARVEANDYASFKETALEFQKKVESKGYKINNIKDYSLSGHPGDPTYKRVHFIIEKNGRKAEVQIGTKRMTTYGDYNHDTMYKIPKSKEALINQHKPELTTYVRSVGDYLNKLDAKEKALAPLCTELIKKLIGCFK